MLRATHYCAQLNKYIQESDLKWMNFSPWYIHLRTPWLTYQELIRKPEKLQLHRTSQKELERWIWLGHNKDEEVTSCSCRRGQRYLSDN